MFSFIPSVVTEREKYLEVMEKIQRDRTYYNQLMEMANPFMQCLYISMIKNDSSAVVNIRRLNPPNVKKSREWNFTYDETTEPVNALAIRILDAIISKKQIP